MNAELSKAGDDSESDLPQPARIVADFLAYQRTLALRTALDLDLFTHIDTGCDTVTSLSIETGATKRGLRILCDFLAVHGHLLKRDERYALPVNSRIYLVADSPAYLGSAARFFSSDRAIQASCGLRRTVETPLRPADSLLVNEAHWIDFALGMPPLSQMVASFTAAALSIEPGKHIDVLDLGAGHGLFGLAVAARNPAAHIFAMDADSVLEIAAENARLADAQDRYHRIPGDAFTADFGGPYDLILAANFAHHFDEHSNVTIFRKCRTALKTGGRLAILEFTANEDRLSPPGVADFGLLMLATTPAGDIYTFLEFSRMLRDAGFAEVQRIDVGVLPQGVITASG